MAAPPYIPSLDGIRAVSFLIVFVAHAGLGHLVPGGFGVTVFFFLSGYLITTLMRLEHDAQGTVSMKHFYLRRVLRILPPFYTVLAAAVLLAFLGALGGKLSLWAVASQTLHFANYHFIYQGFGGEPPGTSVYWSLAVEEHFYFVFPWLYLLLRRLGLSGRGQAAVLVGLCGLVLAWRCALIYGLNAPTDRAYMASDTRVDSILWGCALAVYGNPILDGESSLSSRAWRYALLPAGLLALLASFLVRSPAFRETFRYSLQGLALVPFFVVAIREPGWFAFRFLNLGWVKYLGVLSYGLYLVHHVVLAGVHFNLEPWHLPRWALGLLSLVISLGLAVALHRLIEKPCGKLRKRLSGV